MKFIKYKQVARITLYGFDDLLRDNASSVYTEPLKSEFFTQNINNRTCFFVIEQCFQIRY